MLQYYIHVPGSTGTQYLHLYTTYHGTKVKIFKTQSGRAVREVKSKRGGRGWMRGKCQVVLGVGGREECRSAETVERLAGLKSVTL